MFALKALALLALLAVASGFMQNSAFKVRNTQRSMKMPPPTVVPKSDKPVGETVAGSAVHSTLMAALKAAGLDGVLNGPGPFVLFGPTDEAFKKLPAGTVEGLLKDIPALTDILKMHVSTNTQMPTRNGRCYKTLNTFPDGEEREVGVRVTVDTCEQFLMAGQPNMAKLLSSIQCANGYIHVIDEVLLPYPNKLPPYMEIKEPIPVGYETPRAR